MVGLYRDPRGDHIFGDKPSSATVITNDTVSPFKDENTELKKRIQELELMQALATTHGRFFLASISKM